MAKLMRKYTIYLLLSILFVQSIAFAQPELIEKLKANVKFLSSDELEGRYAGTPGIEKAATFITEQFAKNGLKMFGSSYTQNFDVPIEGQLDSTSFIDMAVFVPKPGVPNDKIKPRSNKLGAGSEWLHLGWSKSGVANGELAFVGYGISAKELSYNDYEEIDVKGKVVICLTSSPDGDKKDSKFGKYTSYTSKTLKAQEMGAVGIIFLKIQGDSANVFDNLDYYDASYIKIPVVQANRFAINRFFPRNADLVTSEKEINNTKKPKSFILPNVTCNINMKINMKQTSTSNLFGYFEGSDSALKSEYVVVGAHYDHLGLRKPRNSKSGAKEIHNGADDNASGTTAMLELMERFGKEKPKRSMIFIAFAAEEMGILGSKHFVANPPIKLETISSMLNLDMVGMSKKDSVEIWGLGTADEFDAIVNKTTDAQGLKITKVQTGKGPSDHSSFAKKNIPVLMFFSGFHPNYHQPTDDWDKLNYDGMSKIVNAATEIAKEMANLTVRPVFKEVKEVKK